MKIAILTSGILPIPAVQGGAVENLIDFYLEYNDKHRLHDITVYSVWHPDVEQHRALKSDINHYIYIKVDSWWAKFKKNLYAKTHGNEYYHYSIEFFLEQALKQISKQHYDMIILENRPGYALKLRRKTNAKIIYHLHNDLLNSETNYAKELSETASRIITVSNYITGRVNTINHDETKCMTVYNGIDAKAFSNNTFPAHIASIESNDFVIVYSGRVNKEKGIAELVEAMNIISRDYPIKLLVIGSSFYGNANNENEFARELMRKAEPLKDRITFTGYIPYPMIPAYLKRADIAVLPSIWDEPFGLTMTEAQAAGLPIITTRQGGIPEVVTNDNAILLEADGRLIDNLAAAITDLYEHPEKRQQMAAASLERSKLFDKETYARNFFKALEL